jgi:hypothetical protein
MFRRGKKKGADAAKKRFKIIGKSTSAGIRTQKKEITKEQQQQLVIDDSDYEDSHRLGTDVAESNDIEVYVDTEDDETDQKNTVVGNSNSYDTGVAVISPTSGGRSQQQQIQSSSTPAGAAPVGEVQVEKAILSDEERKARARKAVQDRKNKSRLDIAARKAKKDGKPIPVATSMPVPVPVVVSPPSASVADTGIATVPLAGETATANQNANAAKNTTNANKTTKAVTPKSNIEQVRRRALSEERHKLLELERQQEQEEREQLEKEEAEMKELEEALKKEEEEAKRLAEQYDDAMKETVVVVETVDSDKVKAEEEAGFVDDADVDVDVEAEKAKLEFEFKELAKQELEADRIRAEELAELQAEVEENARLREAEKKAENLMNQFVTLDKDDDDKDNSIEHVGDVNHRDSALLPDLDDLLDGSLSYHESTILDDAIDGPIVFTDPAASKPNDKKKKETTKVVAAPKPKPKTASTKKTVPKSTVRKSVERVNASKSKKPDKKPATSRYLKPVLPRVAKKQPDTKPNPSVTKSPKPWRNSFTKKPNKKKQPPVVTSKSAKQSVPLPRVAKKQPPVVSKPLKKPVLKPVTKPVTEPPSISKKPNKKPPMTKPLKPVPLPRVIKQQTPAVAPKTPVQPIIRKQPSITNMSHLRTPTNRRGPKIKQSPSLDSMGSHCTFNSIPRSPYGKPPPDMLMCKNQFTVKLHVKPMGCQVCIFKLSEAEKDEYEKDGRHLRVATTFGGCSDCAIFPSAFDEDPVRLCKKCFFDTHLVRATEDDAFNGSGALAGVQQNYGTYNPNLNRYKRGGAYNARTPTPY